MDVAIVVLPLVGAIIAGLFGRQIGDRGAQIVTCALMVIAAILAVPVFIDVAIDGNTQVVELFTWVASG